jgi:UDP-N-acetylglucosamine 2-epimerase (non-hydrolysing)
MKIMTIFGTRPEIIRLSRVMKVLDQFCEQFTVHTGQNYDESLSDIFLRDLKVRTPDAHLGIQSKSFGDQVGQILSKTDDLLAEHKPDKVLILGDTNSALTAIVASRRGIPVYHMEAGNRCYDDRVPEEINRRIVDHSSAVLMPYTHRSKDNLVREGIERERIFVTGNPIKEVLDEFAGEIDASAALETHGVDVRDYFMVTLHRAENVDSSDRLRRIMAGFKAIVDKYEKPMLVSVHPRTAEKLKQFGLDPGTDRIKLLQPLGFFDFVRLEKNAWVVLSDSGTVQEECAIFNIPNVTVRDVTERPETVECGSNIISGAETDSLMTAVEMAATLAPTWEAPEEYMAENVSHTVAKIVLGYNSRKKHVS